MRTGTIVALFAQLLAVAAKKGDAEDAPAPNPVVAYVMGIVMPTWDASLALAQDGAKLCLDVPNIAVDVYVWATQQARKMPDLALKVADSDGDTLGNLSSFAAKMAGTIFCVYAGLTAFNLALGLFVSVKDYFNGYLVLPTSLPVIGKLPGPLRDVRDLIQTHFLDRIRRFSPAGWVIPLEGQSGSPSLKQALPVLAQVTSTCVVLSCAPAIHALIKGGANKAAAEALMYTMGMAVGLSWLVKKA